MGGYKNQLQGSFFHDTTIKPLCQPFWVFQGNEKSIYLMMNLTTSVWWQIKSSVFGTFIFSSLLHSHILLYKLDDPRAGIASLPARVCATHRTEVDVVCVCVCAPWVMLNRDIIGHYCPLQSMVNDQICPAVILTRSQPITVITLNGLNIDCVCFKDKMQTAKRPIFPSCVIYYCCFVCFAFPYVL